MLYILEQFGIADQYVLLLMIMMNTQYMYSVFVGFYKLICSDMRIMNR